MGSLPFSTSIFEGLLGPIFDPSWAHLGPILGPFWAHLGPSWAHLGPSWAHLGPSWAHLGPSWAIWGPQKSNSDGYGRLNYFFVVLRWPQTAPRQPQDGANKPQASHLSPPPPDDGHQLMRPADTPVLQEAHNLSATPANTPASLQLHFENATEYIYSALS